VRFKVMLIDPASGKVIDDKQRIKSNQKATIDLKSAGSVVVWISKL
jgi:hypothetical protein